MELLKLDKDELISSDIKRTGRWTKEEDFLLKSAMEGNPKVSYRQLTERIKGRSANQIRQRWLNHLQPHLKHGEWTEDETKALLQLMLEFGQNWAMIQPKLEQRSFNSIKIKGRNLIGDLLSKGRRAKTRHGFVVGKEGKWSKPEKSLLYQLHRNNSYWVVGESGSIGLNLGKIITTMETETKILRATGDVERMILKTCKGFASYGDCRVCESHFGDLFKTSKDSLEEHLKDLWTKQKAKRMLKTLELNIKRRKVSKRRKSDNLILSPTRDKEKYVILNERFSNVLTQKSADCMQRHLKYTGISLSKMGLSYLLRTKIESKDPRYSLDFIYPQQTGARFSKETDLFDPTREIATVYFKGCYVLAYDSAAERVFGKIDNAFWISLNVSSLQAAFVLGNNLSLLEKNGEVWSRQLLWDMKGCIRLLKTHVKVLPDMVYRYRFQDESLIFPKVLSLPPDL
eukprot:snap_masked-scaffold_11-processed-gene-3.12-mRNA-1 protein AED:0.40 eAED:0.40 QI:0/-1/0/1/-1/1/1/0/456